MAQEDDNIGGRLARYARVGASVGGFGLQVAAARLAGRSFDDPRNAADLRKALGGLKGPVMKIAQILATIPEALPPGFAAELGQLQADAPPMGPAFVRRRMRAELGPEWEARFASFEPTAAHAASLGQVHRATAHDGTHLACKLQYPDMSSAVEADLRQLDLMFAAYRQFDRAIDPSEVRDELADRLREELDYEREAKACALYRHMLRDDPTVTVPDVYDELSTRRLLTMRWLDGRPLLSYKDADLATRNTIAMAMFRAWYLPFYRYGVIHGDPHMGNYAVRDDLGLNLLDFGCIRIFAPEFIRGVNDLFHAVERGDKALAVHAFEQWGFKGLTSEIVDTLLIWATFLYGPLLDDRVRLIDGGGKPGEYGRETAQKVHKQLKAQGTVTVPREFVFMDRAAVGLGGVFIHLKAELNWRTLFLDLLGEFDEAALAKRQAEALALVGLAA